MGRVVSLFDSLLSEQFTNATSVRLMEHAATLDLEDFEDSELQDKLERARRQTTGRMTLMGQLFGQAQDATSSAALMGLRERVRAKGASRAQVVDPDTGEVSTLDEFVTRRGRALWEREKEGREAG